MSSRSLLLSSFTPFVQPCINIVKLGTRSSTKHPAWTINFTTYRPISSGRSSNMDSHNAAVQRISSEVRHFFDRKEPFRINHGSTNSTRNLKSKSTNFVNTGDLSKVLDIDTQRKTALVEPNVPMDRLVEATLKHGLIPPVVMEFPGITVGGGYAGTSGESSSFRYGFFDRTMNHVEMVLPNGEVTQISETNHRELFRSAAGAVGTMGVTTCVELNLKTAKRYVRVEYLPVSSMDDAIEITKRVTAEEDVDYVDGIMFAKNEGAVLVGRLTDVASAGEQAQGFSRPSDPWYYVHVQRKLSEFRRRPSKDQKMVPPTDLIPIADYLFRYDRGGFWVGRSAFQYFRMPFNRLTRWFLDDFLHTRMLYRALHASRSAMPYFVQDLALPYDTAAQFVDYTDKHYGIYPLWLCPLKQDVTPTFHPHDKAATRDQSGQLPMMLNIGLWGWNPKDLDSITANRQLEAKLTELRGMKWFYSQCFYTADEFWSLYDKKWYQDLRRKYNAEHLPDVWQKIRVDIDKEREMLSSWKTKVLKIWPMAGIWGLWNAIKSGDWRSKNRVKVQDLDLPRHPKSE